MLSWIKKLLARSSVVLTKVAPVPVGCGIDVIDVRTAEEVAVATQIADVVDGPGAWASASAKTMWRWRDLAAALSALGLKVDQAAKIGR